MTEEYGESAPIFLIAFPFFGAIIKQANILKINNMLIKLISMHSNNGILH